MYFIDLFSFIQQAESQESRIEKLESALQKLSTLNENQMVCGKWISSIAHAALKADGGK